jgi:hypothetical protein
MQLFSESEPELADQAPMPAAPVLEQPAENGRAEVNQESLLSFLPDNLGNVLTGGTANRLNDGAITFHSPDSGAAYLEVPAELPEEYQLEVLVRQETEGGSFAVTFPHKGFPACFVVDGINEGQETYSGISNVNEAVRGRRFTDQRTHSIHIISSPDGILVNWDGMKLAEYAGKADRLSLEPRFEHPNQLWPTFRADLSGGFVIERATITTKADYVVKAVPVSVTPAIADTAPVPVKVDEPDYSKPRSVTPTFEGPESLDVVRLSDFPTFAAATDREGLAEWYEAQKAKTERFKGRTVHLVIGRVVLENGDASQLVNSALFKIRPDGTFVHLVRDLKIPFGIRAHGYEQVDVQLTGCQGAVVDVGTIQLQKLPESLLGTLTGRIALEGNENLDSVSVTVHISLGPSNNIAGIRIPREQQLSASLASDGTFTLNGFSPAKYVYAVRAPGYVYSRSVIDFSRTREQHLQVQLERTRTLHMEYVFAEESQESAFDKSAIEEDTWTGGDQWQFPDGYTPFELKQKNGALEFSSHFYGTRIKDLGQGDITEFLDVKRSSDGMSDDLPAQTGHVYLIYQDYVKTYMLLRVKEITQPDLRDTSANAKTEAASKVVGKSQVQPSGNTFATPVRVASHTSSIKGPNVGAPEVTGATSLSNVDPAGLPTCAAATDRSRFESVLGIENLKR